MARDGRMSKREGSVAPRERVNIMYKTYVGDAVEEVELPLRFLVLGDFTGEETDIPVEKRSLVGVDKDNFDEVLAAQHVKFKARVPNKLAEQEGPDVAVSLEFRQMKDFGPDAICRQVPELKALVDLRDALTALKGPMGNVPAFRKRLQAILDDPESHRQLLDELNIITKKPKP